MEVGQKKTCLSPDFHIVWCISIIPSIQGSYYIDYLEDPNLAHTDPYSNSGPHMASSSFLSAPTHIGNQIPSGDFAPNLMLKKCGFKQRIQEQNGNNPHVIPGWRPTYIADMHVTCSTLLPTKLSQHGQQLFCIKTLPDCATLNLAWLCTTHHTPCRHVWILSLEFSTVKFRLHHSASVNKKNIFLGPCCRGECPANSADIILLDSIILLCSGIRCGI